jgi:hypothetical protein
MRRDLAILVALFVGLAALIALGPARSASTPGTSASSHASGPGGALALYRWLDDLGYETTRIQHRDFAPDPEADLLILLDPSERVSREEAAAVAAWVEGGGTLLLAESRTGAFAGGAALLDAFELRVVALDAQTPPPELLPVTQPVLALPLAAQLEARASAVLSSERADLAPLAEAGGQPVIVGFQQGAGYVYAASAVHPFTNAGLGQADNAALVLNILRRVPQGGRVAFDEYHHGFIAEPSLRRLLLETPWGWAILYAAAVGAGYLLLTGRRFGRPVPLRAEAARRSSAEYLESLAGLLGRAGKTDDVRRHYRAGLKRRLARTYGLNPDLEDAPFLEALADASPAQASAAAAALAQLDAAPDERALLQALAEADRVAGRA